MKAPKLGDLRRDHAGTRRIRSDARKGAVKITLNIDHDSLHALRSMADEAGIPYQRLLNRILKEGLVGRETTQARLDRLEREINKVKRQIAA